MMDDEPFLSVDFGDAAKAQISDTVLAGLFALTKTNFDPETVSENARRNITHRAFYDYLSGQFTDPTIDFTRFLLKEVDIKHVRATAVDGFRSIAKAAFNDVFTSHVLARLDITGAPSRPSRSEPTVEVPVEPAAATGAEKNGIVTTEGELHAFEAICRRLAFLAAGDAELFKAIDRVAYRDYQGKMAVFYAQERKGRLLDIHEGKDHKIRFALADDGDPSPVTDLTSIDERLHALFARKVIEIA